MVESPYTFFDDIICINLKSRPDRRDYVKKTLSNVNIPFRFYTAEKSPYGGIYGCFESHINVIQEAYNKGANNILIFEDDVKPLLSYSEQHIKKAVDFMKNNEWDIFYLGYLPFNIHAETIFVAKKVDDNIYKYSALSTSTYCLNKRSMEKILYVYKQYIGILHIDIFYNIKEYFPNTFCYVPQLFSQKTCLISDIPPKNILEAVLRKYQCMEEMFDISHNSSLLTYNREVYITIIVLVLITFTITLSYVICAIYKRK